MGPTAAGKTDAAILLHEKYGCEIISVDSALVYKSMNIGTAKPDAETLLRAPHQLVDVIEPWQSYSAANFCQDAYQHMQRCHHNNTMPLLAGGTMMYYHRLQNGLSAMPDADQTIRQLLIDEAAEKGWAYLHERLKSIDPLSAQRINVNDPQRIQRALEVHQITGQTMSQLHQQDQGNQLDYQRLKIIIAPDRALLHQRIEQRFHLMMKHGFIEEVEALKKDPRLNIDLPSMRCVGYRQVWQYLDGQLTRDEMIFKGVVATRQLAKRQWTWLRKEQDAIWLDPTKKDYLLDIQRLTEDFMAD